MPNSDLVSVAEYPDAISVKVGSALLTSMGVPHRVYPRAYYLRGDYYYIWVSPELAEEARRILETTVLSEDELENLALKYPPPDDA
jgi:hypothetical protein